MLTSAEMQALEARAFADGVSAGNLLEEAGRKIAEAVQQFHPEPGSCLVYFGKGHNGGDALVAARQLLRAGWEVELRAIFPEADWAELTKRQHQEFAAAAQRSSGCLAGRRSVSVILDGLLGIGSRGALHPQIRAATREINQLRLHSNARVFALDLPTGLNADTGAADPDAVLADYTLTIGCAKSGLLADSAARYVGRLAVLPLAELTARFGADHGPIVSTPAALAEILPRRHFDIHKGACGRVGIIAGSPGLTGAAILCAEAAVHAGAGLVSLYVAPEIHTVVAARIIPDVMVRPISSFKEILSVERDVLALGPGLGRERDGEVLEIIASAPRPVIIDADGLNALASDLAVLEHCAGPRLLTPHPGEMARLQPDSSSTPRRELVEAFTTRFPVTLLLKGSRTIIGERGRALSYNTTGSPGMATGGMGDALTGVCAALSAQGLALYDAARLGSWLCGRAAECAIAARVCSEESLSAHHLIQHLGDAFRELRGGGY
ncbi:MAG TPA: NAD(P)H-hydrate dehydratase [Chthoniobacteraceae bacterium]